MKKLSLLGALLAFGVATASAADPDIIILRGEVFTPQSPATFAQAVAITGNRITAVGTVKEILALAGPGTKRIDAGGRLVIPGLNDAHVHFEILPPFFTMLTTPNSVFSEVQAAIAGAVDETTPDTRYFGIIGAPTFFDSNATAQALNTVALGRAVMLSEFTGHGLILSTAALNAFAGASPVDPIGGSFERNAQGQLTGKVFEYAEYGLLRKLVDTTGDQENIDALRALSDQALAFGITTLQIMPTMAARRFETVVEKAKVRVRIRVMRLPVTDQASLNVTDNQSGGIHAVKWILDGTPVEHGAALRVNYPGTGLSGTINFTEQQLRDILGDAISHHEQPLLHVAGDRTAERVLKVMKAMGSPAQWSPRRLRFEHGDGVQRDLIRDVAELGVVVVQNPTHFPFRNFYPEGDYMFLKTLLARDVRLAFGSDGELNPFLNISLAVTHPGVPAEAISLSEALRAYTTGSAFAELVDDKGAIAAGQLADIAILSQNLFKVRPAGMANTGSVMTIVNGKIVFDAGVLP
jgi:predicted amidohydrolase YtcJ